MIVTVAELKEQIGWTDGLGTADDELMGRKIAAAQDHIERLLGFKIETTYPPAGDPPASTVPAALVEAVLQLAAHRYENREATLVGVTAQEIPFGVWSIVNEYREWSFG
ncbi:head-tail connector protein [Neorhizobium sp. T25_13]|uniref:head-tail connector protein n=1 Tax=Neorhizobium sp. T25_13 TaxID=2093830 RepID=UPI000CF95358|nr:head-tail connector protein [Neorhizobium sp. T25_13]